MRFKLRTLLIGMAFAAITLAALRWLGIRDEMLAFDTQSGISLYRRTSWWDNDSRDIIRPSSNMIVALQQTPHPKEEELSRGTWLILAWAVWSLDRYGFPEAVAMAHCSQGRYQVGVRAFDALSELEAAWNLELNPTSTPIWIVLKDGVVVGECSGQISSERLSAFVEQAILE